MKKPFAWLGKNNPIIRISFFLMTGFDDNGQPKYIRGTVASVAEQERVQSVLEPLRPEPHSITSVVMGQVTIEVADGSEINIQPVYSPTMDTYRDYFFVEERQFKMPESFAEFLERWRKNLPSIND